MNTDSGEYVPRHAAQDIEVEHLDLCNPEVIFTPAERAELNKDLGQIALKQRQAAAQASKIYLD